MEVNETRAKVSEKPLAPTYSLSFAKHRKGMNSYPYLF